MRIIEDVIRQINFQLKVTSPFLNSRYVSPLEPAYPLYCASILVWSIYTIYVSGKLVHGGGGGHTSKLKMVINLFLQLLTENKFVLIHVSMIRTRDIK